MKRFEIHIGSRFIGTVLLGICLVFAIVLVFLINEMKCPCDAGVCPIERFLPISYAGFAAVLVLGIIGVFMLIPKRTERMEKTDDWKRVLKNLKDEERIVYQAIMDSGGILPQGDIVDKTGLSKVKVSRILDKLEIKNLVERRRRGMINVIVLK